MCTKRASRRPLSDLGVQRERWVATVGWGTPRKARVGGVIGIVQAITNLAPGLDDGAQVSWPTPSLGASLGSAVESDPAWGGDKPTQSLSR